MFRIVTVAREYGSGGGVIARNIADSLGWRLLDQSFLIPAGAAAGIDPEAVRRYDEHVDSRWRRFHQCGLRAAAVMAGSNPPDVSFGAETIANLAHDAIVESAASGECVIVGRGAQCALQGRREAFHVFVYGPWEERVRRVYSRTASSRNVEN